MCKLLYRIDWDSLKIEAGEEPHVNPSQCHIVYTVQSK